MKTESAGLSREEFEKWVVGYFYDGKRLLTRNGEGYFDDDVDAHWDCWQAASLKQAEPSDEAEPPSQPERCEHGVWIADHCWQCNCGAGDDAYLAYLACHADVCALKKWAAPRYEISQATKEECARRIAEFVASKYAGGRWYEEVLALMTAMTNKP